jgi:hypothetical protein
MVRGIKDYFKVLWVSFVSWSQAVVEDDGEPEVRKIKLPPSSICTYETEKPEAVRRKLSIKDKEKADLKFDSKQFKRKSILRYGNPGCIKYRNSHVGALGIANTRMIVTGFSKPSNPRKGLRKRNIY